MIDSTENEDEINILKRRKLGTLNYIHKKLFKESHNSDIKIVAFNREWDLHKIILSQSPYFNSMFSGSWNEKTLKEINLGIEDVNITEEALHKVFESLYSGEIEVEPTEAVPILACASFFQLDDLIKHCTEVMKSSINKDTAICFFEAAELYGTIEEVKLVSFDWLCKNTWSVIYAFPKLLMTISEDLWKKLLVSPDLCVIKEYSVFKLLTAWVFLKEKNFNFCYDSIKGLSASSLQYFQGCEAGKTFLETDSGIPYQSLYRAVRLNYLILDFEDIEKYNVIPMGWITPVIKRQWCHMSRIYKGLDKGPNSVTEDVFNKECMRVSGYAITYREFLWCGCFDFEFGLGFRYENGCFKIKRDNRSVNSLVPASSNRGERYLMYRVSLFTIGKEGRVLSKAGTGIRTVSMAPNEEIEVLTFVPAESIRVRCMLNFLFTTP